MAPRRNLPPGTRFGGHVERVTYFNTETGHCVFSVRFNSTQIPAFVTGRVPWIADGLCFEATLCRINAEGFLHAENIHFDYPTTERALRRFLNTGALKGVGAQLAKILAKTLPGDFFSYLEASPSRLSEVPGIGTKKAAQIATSWLNHKNRVALREFLFQESMPLSWADALWLQMGPAAIAEFSENPYSVADLLGLDFALVDSFGLKKGSHHDSDVRLSSGLKHTLREHFREGHCAFPEQETLAEAEKLLEVPASRVEEILELEILSQRIVMEEVRGVSCLFLKEVWDLEHDVAKKFQAFHKKEPPWGWFNSPKLLSWAQNILNIRLADLQKSAIETALSSSLTVITGGPGTGKTTLIRSLVTILQTQSARFALCSPTGRAAQRLGEATGMPARTLHRLLKFDARQGRFTYNRENPLPLDLLLVDEASMLDLTMAGDLLDALPPSCALILVGDADQIPSVGAGNILHSLIACDRFQVVRLTDVYRQGSRSLIKENAKLINAGELPRITKAEGGDFHYIPVRSSTEAKAKLLSLVTHVLPRRFGILNLSESQVLVPLNRGELGTQKLNEELQKVLNTSPDGYPRRGTSEYGQNFYVGDKVMVIRNDYGKEVFNGDVGFIQSIQHEELFLTVRFGDRDVRFEFREMDRLTLAYAISIHKAQGSEYRAAIVILTDEHLPMAQKHLVYTAVTRGKERVFLIAEPNALETALKTDSARWEKLTELLVKGPGRPGQSPRGYQLEFAETPSPQA